MNLMNLMNLASSSMSLTGGEAAGAIAIFMAIFAAFIIVFLFIGLVFYIYMSLSMMSTAKKLNTEYAWLPWIPFVGKPLAMARMAKMHWWPVLLIIVMLLSNIENIIFQILGWVASIAFLIYSLIWLWKICENRGKPGWWAILVIIPIIGQIWFFIMWGILAWSK